MILPFDTARRAATDWRRASRVAQAAVAWTALVAIVAVVSVWAQLPHWAILLGLLPAILLGDLGRWFGVALSVAAALLGAVAPSLVGLGNLSPGGLLHVLPIALCLGAAAWLKSRERRAIERAGKAADTDALTGVWNRRGFLSLLTAEIHRARKNGESLAVAVLDCDDFKQLNDRQGHLAGDRYLLDAVSALQRCLRPYDVLGRRGGDEFTILLPAIDFTATQAQALQLHESLSKLKERRADSPTWSIGVAFYTQPGDAEAMLDRADHLMLAAKKFRKGAVRVEAVDQRLHPLAEGGLDQF